MKIHSGAHIFSPNNVRHPPFVVRLDRQDETFVATMLSSRPHDLPRDVVIITDDDVISGHLVGGEVSLSTAAGIIRFHLQSDSEPDASGCRLGYMIEVYRETGMIEITKIDVVPSREEDDETEQEARS